MAAPAGGGEISARVDAKTRSEKINGAESSLEPPRKNGSRSFQAGWLWLALAAALVLRLWRLDAALWYDEAFSGWLAQLPLNQLLQATLGDVHPPGYYLVLWAVTRLAGHGEWALRLTSLLAGLGLVVLVWRLGRALSLNPGAVTLATAITALSPFQIYYSQEARAYALLTLAVALAAYALLTARPWLAVAASLIALYLHNLAPVFIGTIWLAYFLQNPKSKIKNPWPGVVVMAGYRPAWPGCSTRPARWARATGYRR